jgi:hypothetical protein
VDDNYDICDDIIKVDQEIKLNKSSPNKLSQSINTSNAPSLKGSPLKGSPIARKYLRTPSTYY